MAYYMTSGDVFMRNSPPSSPKSTRSEQQITRPGLWKRRSRPMAVELKAGQLDEGGASSGWSGIFGFRQWPYDEGRSKTSKRRREQTWDLCLDGSRRSCRVFLYDL